MADDIGPAGFSGLFLKPTSLIDVRAPIEFKAGHLPGAVNLPLLNDEERAAVGTTYKISGQAAAVELGHKLISGEVKQARIGAWLNHLRDFPDAVFYCFRGGMRSQISRQWTKEHGIARPLLIGGYKAGRRFFTEKLAGLSAAQPCRIVTGPTGSGKTLLLEACAGIAPVLDLEKLANHRGSAFGGFTSPQPSQIDFENGVALELLKIDSLPSLSGPLLIEDESRMIGRCSLPEKIFDRIRNEPALLIDESVESRVETIFNEYILRAPQPEKLGGIFRAAISAITKKLGGVNTKEVLELLSEAEKVYLEGQGLLAHRRWIEKLLIFYYDPLYKAGLQRRDPKIAFRGSRAECLSFIRTNWTPQA